ncbi:MAG: hypothetical protein ISR59_12170, partial [Anaerolineales bacterium]|nr:hypothetical protein [Anaerolineales bacterium]
MGSYSAIREWADKEVSQQTADKARIVIGLGTCGIAAGGNAILTAAKNTVA